MIFIYTVFVINRADVFGYHSDIMIIIYVISYKIL